MILIILLIRDHLIAHVNLLIMNSIYIIMILLLKLKEP